MIVPVMMRHEGKPHDICLHEVHVTPRKGITFFAQKSMCFQQSCHLHGGFQPGAGKQEVPRGRRRTLNLKVTTDLLIFFELVTHTPRTKDQQKKVNAFERSRRLTRVSRWTQGEGGTAAGLEEGQTQPTAARKQE
jgi:hypothetical protein